MGGWFSTAAPETSQLGQTEAGSRTITAQSGGVASSHQLTGVQAGVINMPVYNYQTYVPPAARTEETNDVPAAPEGAQKDKHFVDKYKLQLIDRVTNIPPILDVLLEKEVIDQENYNRIIKLPTSQDKMRELYSGCLQASKRAKDIFYDALKQKERYLIKDLNDGI